MRTTIASAAALTVAIVAWWSSGPERHEARADEVVAVAATVITPVAPAPAEAAPAPWTFAVISDLHTPDSGKVSPALQQAIAAVIEARPRFVVVAGDSTNGNPEDSRGRVALAPRWWRAVRATLAPLRAAGIPVLPVAGNHDTYLPGQRAAYAAAFADLADWAAPLAITAAPQPAGGVAVDAAPFSYAVDVDGVHLALTHVVDLRMDKAVMRWLAADLAGSRAPVKIVVGHVPLASVMNRPSERLRRELGSILVAGGADLYIAGHEHLVWDEDVELAGGRVRQVVVGTAHGTYNYGPTYVAQRRARCQRQRGAPTRCMLPNGGDFALHIDRHHRAIQHHRQTFTVFTVDGDRVTATPMAIDEHGSVVRFAL